MKNDKLIDAIGRVEEDLIYEAEVSVPRYQPSAMERLRDRFTSGSSLMRGGAVAVCAVLLIAVGLTIGHWQMGTKKADMTAEGSNEAAGETSSEAKAIEEEKAVEEAYEIEEEVEEAAVEEEAAAEEEMPAEEEAPAEEAPEAEEDMAEREEAAEEAEEAEDEIVPEGYFLLRTENSRAVLSLDPAEEETENALMILDESRMITFVGLEPEDITATLLIPADDPKEEIALEVTGDGIRIPSTNGQPAMIKLLINYHGESIERNVYAEEEN